MALRALITGEIVDTDKRDWTLSDGQQGTTFSLYLRCGSARDGAQQVKVQPGQYGTFKIGDHVELPCDIYARAGRTAARLDVVLQKDFDAKKALHAAA